MSKLKIVLFSLFTLLSLQLFAEPFAFTPIKSRIVSPKITGLGGPFSAQRAGFDTLFTNPAALANIRKSLSVARLTTEVSGPIFDLPVVFASDDMSSSLSSLVAENKGIFLGLGMTGPIALGKVDKNFGFGIFTNSLLKVDIPSLTKATLLAGEEILITGAYGLRIYEKEDTAIDLGFQLKGFFQTLMYEKGTSIAIIDSATSLNPKKSPIVLSTGCAVDLGMLFTISKYVDAGIVVRNVYAPVFSTRYGSMKDFFDNKPDSDTLSDLLEMDISTGFAFKIPLPSQLVTISSWTLYVDYKNWEDIAKPLSKNIVLNFGFGSEIIVLDVISMRAGIYETYLAAGFGLDLTLFQIDFAMYGRELGIEPGRRPVLNLVVGVTFEY